MVKGTSQCDPTKWKCDSSTELAHFITGSYKLLPPTSFSFNLNGDDDSRLFNRQSKYSSRSRLRSSQYSAHHNGRKLNYYSSTIAFSLDRLSDFYDERNVITVRGGGVVSVHFCVCVCVLTNSTGTGTNLSTLFPKKTNWSFLVFFHFHLVRIF